MITTHIDGYRLVLNAQMARVNHGPQYSELTGDVKIVRQADMILVYLKERQEWLGNDDGLPPVGTECLMSDGNYAGVKVKIIAHDGCLAVFSLEGQYVGRTAKAFRKLKTVSELLAEERQAAIAEMSKVYYAARGGNDVAMGAIYDAGYRKQVAE